jgi:hypothetical protein
MKRHDQRLTDEAWRSLLKTPSRPAPPPWLKVLGEGSEKSN